MATKPIPEYRTITPYLIVNGAAKAIEFYKKAFGAIEYVRLAGPMEKIMHAEIRINHSRIMLADEFPEMGYHGSQSIGGLSVSLLLYVEDVDAVFSVAVAAGAKEKVAVADQFDGDRRGTLTDLFGHVWLLATRKETISLEEMHKRFDSMMKSEA